MKKLITPFLVTLLSTLTFQSIAQDNVVRGVIRGEVEYKATSLQPDGTCYAQLEDGRELEVKFDDGIYNIPIPADYKGESVNLTVESLGEKKRTIVYLNQLGTTHVNVIRLKCTALRFVTTGCPSF